MVAGPRIKLLVVTPMGQSSGAVVVAVHERVVEGATVVR
jgi:phage baseplate assembly protein W